MPKNMANVEVKALRLAARREKMGISLEQIVAHTKISARSLHAIEEGEFDKLPGGIYSKSYIRQYAASVDYDGQELLEIFSRAVATEPDETPERKPVSRFLRASSALLGIQ